MEVGVVTADTIHALATGGLPAAIAVMRLSGPACRFVLETTLRGVPVPRRAVLRWVRDRDGSVVDQALVLWMPGPASYTGEDMVEFHLHGSRAVVAAMTRLLGTFADVRPAEPGEFTKRAFLAGRLDLTEVEGFADLLAAETEAQRRQALAQSAGRLARLYGTWREQTIRIRALLEAEIDFVEEDDIPTTAEDDARSEARGLAAEMGRHLDDGHRGERLRNGFQVVLLGAPNAGKSSLLNALARRDVAIVTAEAGTTRDLVEVHLDLGGVPVTVVDTAGLREAVGLVEQEGIRRALSRAAGADLVLWLRAPDVEETKPSERRDLGDGAVWLVETKADLEGVSDGTEVGDRAGFRVSSVTGSGLGELVAALAREATERWVSSTREDGVGPTRERHRTAIERCRALLLKAADAGDMAIEVRAEVLRSASGELERLTGRVGADDLLDVIFREFCVGK